MPLIFLFFYFFIFLFFYFFIFLFFYFFIFLFFYFFIFLFFYFFIFLFFYFIFCCGSKQQAVRCFIVGDQRDLWNCQCGGEKGNLQIWLELGPSDVSVVWARMCQSFGLGIFFYIFYTGS